jgi:hypothetical protein
LTRNFAHPTTAPGDSVYSFSPLIYISDESFTFLEHAGDESINISRNHIIKAFYYDTVFELERVPISRTESIFFSTRRMRAPVRLMLTGPGELPPPGTFILFRIYSAIAEDVLRVPANALYQSLELGYYVYRMENGQKIPVQVEAGLITDTYAEIQHGLEEGDEVYVRP